MLAFPLSFLLFGLGFLLILVQRERRALHDLIAGTAVVYDWDARACLPALPRPSPGRCRLTGFTDRSSDSRPQTGNVA